MPNTSRSRTTPTTHKALIAELKRYPEVRTHGFWNAMRRLPDADYVPAMLRNDPEYLRERKFVPDAWAVDAESRTVTIFEAVATHDVPPGKVCNIVNFAWALDEDCYSLGMVRCDLSGRRIYDCLTMGMAMEFEHPSECDSVIYRGWQRYTTDLTGPMRASPPETNHAD